MYKVNRKLLLIILSNSCYAKSVFDLPRPEGRGLKRPKGCGL